MDNSIRNYYEDNPKGGKSSDPQATMRFDLLEKEVNKYKPKKILDVGCGKGHLAQRLAKYSQTYVGVDFSQKAIQLAQASVPQAEFVVADATKLPFADDEFDLVICTEVLEHIPDYQKCLRELARVLQKQGYMVITLPNFYNPVVLWRMLIKGKNTSQAYDCPIPYRKLLRELDQVGLSLVTISSFYIRYPLSRLVPRGIDKVMTYLMEKINKIVPVKLYLFICLKKP